MSEETKRKMSNSKMGCIGNSTGIKWGDEAKQKLSDMRTGKKQKIITCPHCGKDGGNATMPRWHFDNCKQKGEKTIFKEIKQWGSFGSGTSIVKSVFAKQCAFSSIYEHGYGEDADFGMQLRNVGCDIIYHPETEILHLKAPMGGFREKPVLAWEQEEPLPKPSPTLMAFALKYYTPQQIKGFKASLFLKYYNKQSVKNPLAYAKSMKKRWKVSEEWAQRLLFRTSKV
jgi:hypothetical protein